MVSDTVLLEFTEQETGVKSELALRDIVDYSFVRQVDKEIR
jgi:hypothetical protein